MLARPEIIDQPAEVGRLLGIMTEASPMAARFVAIPRNPDGGFDPERLEAATGYGFRIIRWHPEDPDRVRSR
jgi:hypothetical protein